MTDYEKLCAELRGDFALTVREMCADDRFTCDDLCGGNICTQECIIFQAADAIEQLQIDVKALRGAANSFKAENGFLRGQLETAVELSGKEPTNG